MAAANQRNRLAGETSPYLRQHRDNPVAWYPWGPDAFTAARRDDKPLLISIGYASCHWCHVMAHESFEDPETARLMNEHFVNVKVDREERPDVDAIYMAAVQAMTGSGGWPLTVAATPEGAPFFGGTYFPPDDRFGRPSFRRVLTALASAWRERRGEVLESAAGMRQHLGRLERIGGAEEPLTPELPAEAVRTIRASLDERHGGFGGAPKFPPHAALRFLLARPEPEARDVAELTLDRMAQGGIYDQLGGGFARYAVDASWTVPHFEKMLYDNAQLVSAYSRAYGRWGSERHREVVEETLAWAEREMLLEGGAYASSLDADTEGEEGRFYAWTLDEIERVLGADAELAASWLGVTAEGNFEGRNVLTARVDRDELAERFGMDRDRLRRSLAEIRARLMAAREGRPRPARDDKVLTSWNGLMIGALADAGRFLARPDYLDRARAAARTLHDRAAHGGRLKHVIGDGVAKVEGLLEDYAYLGLGLLQLYRATFEPRWLTWALKLGDAVMEHFHDAERGGFFTTPDDGEALLVRPKEPQDAATPAASAAAAELVARLARLTDDARRSEAAAASARPFVEAMRQHPTAFASLLTVTDHLTAPPREVAVIGPRRHPATRELLGALARPLPRVLLAHAESPRDRVVGMVPVLQHRGLVDGAPAAYVCEAGACRLPTTDAVELRRQLDEASRLERESSQSGSREEDR